MQTYNTLRQARRLIRTPHARDMHPPLELQKNTTGQPPENTHKDYAEQTVEHLIHTQTNVNDAPEIERPCAFAGAQSRAAKRETKRGMLSRMHKASCLLGRALSKSPPSVRTMRNQAQLHQAREAAKMPSCATKVVAQMFRGIRSKGEEKHRHFTVPLKRRSMSTPRRNHDPSGPEPTLSARQCHANSTQVRCYTSLSWASRQNITFLPTRWRQNRW